MMRAWAQRFSIRAILAAVMGLVMATGVSVIGVPPMPAAAASTSATQSVGATLSLSPVSGPPGTVVTLHGDVPGLLKAPPAFEGVTVCLGLCQTGYTEQSLPLHFLGNGRFTVRFTLPKVPMLTARGPVPLVNGAYRLGFTCIGPNMEGCDGRTVASATFTVTHSTVPVCSPRHPCAGLTLTPKAAAPGQMVSVSGFAPLAPMLGSGQPWGYELALEAAGKGAVVAQMGQVRQSPSGRIAGTFRMPEALPGLGTVRPGVDRVVLQYQMNTAAATVPHLPAGVSITRRGKVVGRGKGRETFGYELINLSPTALTVSALPTWAALGTLDPKRTQWSQPLPLSIRTPSGREQAYCVPGGIRLTQNGGKTFARVDTEGAAVASVGQPFPIGNDVGGSVKATPGATCSAVLWDPNDPHTFYAVFGAMNRKYDSIPPVYSVLYETRNGGRTWAPVPVPSGYSQGDFGGIQVVHEGRAQAVQVVFGKASDAVGLAPAHTTAEISTDGGASWKETHLTCPAVGPCLRFGAMPGMAPGMGTGDLQPLVRSTDGGVTWQTLAWPTGNVEAQGMLPTGQSELAWLGGEKIAYLDPASQYQLRLTQNGGASWTAIALPMLPGTGPTVQATGIAPYQVLMLLPNGDLLSALNPPNGGLQQDAKWFVLRPGADHWVSDPAISAPDVLGRLWVAGGRLYGLRFLPTGTLTVSGVTVAPMPDMPSAGPGAERA